jgi:predicted ATP-grasp superfamily ATP-dependent carboligase
MKLMEQAQGPFSVLIPDGSDHELLVLQVVNCLALKKDVKIYIISSKRLSYLRFSRHVKRLIYRSKTNAKNWIKHIDEVVDAYSIDIILPVFEIGIKHLIENQIYLRHKDKLCISPNELNFKTAGYKDLLYNHLKFNDFPCPESIISNPKNKPNVSRLNFPIIAKPVYGFGGGQNSRVLHNEEDIQSYVNSVKYSCNTIYQNFIKGHDISCNVLCKEGALLAYTIQDGNIFKNDGLTPLAGFNFIRNDELLLILEALMKSLNWSGVANIDFRYDEDVKAFKIIEVNTRYWINVDASALADVNFPYLHCLATLGRKVETKPSKTMSYLNLKGFVRSVAKTPSLLLKVYYLSNNTAVGYALKDPLPIIYKFVWRTKNILVGKLSKTFN